jgi:hypothetical protein
MLHTYAVSSQLATKLREAGIKMDPDDRIELFP